MWKDNAQMFTYFKWVKVFIQTFGENAGIIQIFKGKDKDNEFNAKEKGYWCFHFFIFAFLAHVVQ